MLLYWAVFSILATVWNYGSAQNTYTAYIPMNIRPGFEIGYTISIFNTNNPVRITSTFYSTDNAIQRVSRDTVANGKSARIVIGMIPLGYAGATKFVLNITGVDSVSTDQIFHNSTEDFVFATKAFSIFIQTDKAIYKPGHTIKFRAICLNSDLRPLNETVTYQVQDPNDNIVLLQHNVSLTQGVAGGEFPLNRDSVVGDWKISYIVQRHKESLPVTVQVYKLPKFEVKLEIPSYIHPKMAGFTVKLTATYTYGKPVDGVARIVIAPVHRYYYGPQIDIFSPEGMQRTISHSEKKFEGAWEVFIPMDQIRGTLGWTGSYSTNFQIYGLVTEKFTEITFNDTQQIDAQPTNIKVNTLFKSDTIKPGLTYTAYIEVSEFDGKRLMEEDRQNNDLILDITYDYPRGHQFPEDTTTPSPWAYPTRQFTQLYDIPSNGIVTVNINAKADEFISMKLVPYTNTTMDYGRYNNQFETKRAQSPSNSFLQISTADNSASPGRTTSVTIKTTEPISTFQILILGRGEILRNVSYTTGDGRARTSHSYSFPVTHSMVPGVQVLASYVRADGEIVADNVRIAVSLALEDQVLITSSSPKVDAGQNLSIRIETNAPGSLVGARAIDQSVLLLKSGNDITKDRVVKDLDKYSVSDDHDDDDGFSWWWWYYPRASGAKDATEVFEKAGIICLTNALLYSGTEHYDYRYPEIFDDGAIFADIAFDSAAQPSIARKTSSSSAATSKPRTLFPETWLWNKQISGSDGSVVFNTTAPDTITSWVISAFSVSDQYGLGVADTSKITVFRTFFVSLNLPLKITRGEIIIVQAIVFNYFKTDLSVYLSLRNSTKFELILPGSNATAAGPERSFVVKANSAYSIKFPIRINTLGEVPVTVSAASQLAGDAITRIVFVRPEGLQECYTSSTLINRISTDDDPISENLEIRFPSGIIEGSAKANLYVYGDILGSTMNNLGRLLQTPGGCGEQNMLRFAPDVFVTIYLVQANALDVETRDKAYGHIRDGYSIELKYKHDDGSYSAFGERDQFGSTWLTAFVIKCFLYARIVSEEFVETSILDQGLKFLVETQNQDGSFAENGHVSHRAMQGGVNNNITMTAYVLITLRETDYPSKNVEVLAASKKARSYLEGKLDKIIEDKYALSLVTYALQVSGSSSADVALGNLEKLATVSGGMKFWHQATPRTSSYNQRWQPPYYQVPSNDIEMTSYALLTYASRGDVGSASPIVKWLTSKQNQFGGYSSTQDTVMAVQALSQVAALLVDRPQSLTISITHSGVKNFIERYRIDETNSIVFNTLPLEPVDGTVRVVSEGHGVGVAQLSVCYNIPEDPYIDEPFDCENSVSSNSVDKASVDFCCRLKPDESDPTGMFLIEVGLPNGFTVDLDREKSRNERAQLVELGEKSVNVYFNELGPSTGICASVELQRYADVAAVKPSSIVASDYYKPEKRVARLYSHQRLADSGACEVCGSDCVGCPGVALSDWRDWTPCAELCRPETSTRVRECVDPNQDRVVDASRCGVIEIPTQARICPKESFPCPDSFHGFWFDLPLAYKSRYPSYHGRNCYLRGRNNRTARAIPGTVLSGSRDYVSCYHDEYLSSNLNGTTGFSISFLVKTETYPLNKSLTYFSFGPIRKSPIFHLEKLWWRNELRFTLKQGKYRYQVKKIPTESLVGSWRHVVVTWNKREGANVYIDGEPKGYPSRVLAKYPFRSKRYTAFFFGKTTSAASGRAANLRGALSGYMFWSTALRRRDVEELTTFFRPILNSEEEPLLSVRHLRFFSPISSRYCFTTPARLSALYEQGSQKFGSVCQQHVVSPFSK